MASNRIPHNKAAPTKVTASFRRGSTPLLLRLSAASANSRARFSKFSIDSVGSSGPASMAAMTAPHAQTNQFVPARRRPSDTRLLKDARVPPAADAGRYNACALTGRAASRVSPKRPPEAVAGPAAAASTRRSRTRPSSQRCSKSRRGNRQMVPRDPTKLIEKMRRRGERIAAP